MHDMVALFAWSISVLVLLQRLKCFLHTSSCRANAQQPKLFVGMILILIFAEALALYGLIGTLHVVVLGCKSSARLQGILARDVGKVCRLSTMVG